MTENNEEFSWRTFLREDDWTNQVYTPEQITDSLTIAVFDLDNTLIDSKAKLTADTVGAFKRLNPKIPSEEVLKLWDELGNWYKIAEKYGIPKQEFDDAFDQRKTWEQSLADREVPIFPETVPTLDKLKKRQMKLAILSKSLPSYTQTKLDYFGLTPYFEEIQTIHPKEPSKDPAAIELIKKIGPQHLERAYFIGDREEDVTAERAVKDAYKNHGITTGGIYVNRQGKQLDDYPSITNLEQILEII